MGEPRVKLRFPDPEALQAALATEDALPGLRVVNERRSYLAVSGEVISLRAISRHADHDTTMALTVDGDLAELLEPDKVTDAVRASSTPYGWFVSEYGAEAVPDVQYDLELIDVEGRVPDAEVDAALHEMRLAADADRADGAGSGVTVAVVDTGVDATWARIDSSRRVGGWAPPGKDPWVDPRGHGSLSARIACGADGFAPAAGVTACATKFYDTELAAIYDYLVNDLLPGLDGPLIATNSFGIRTGWAPSRDRYGDFDKAMLDAVEAGVLVVFSAGNYHELVGGRPDACDPTSIWTFKCNAEPLVVSAADGRGGVHTISSRGPGQFADESWAAAKPDLCAPVPVAAWGTSAAAPQVAGAAARHWSTMPAAPYQQIRADIVGAALSLGLGPTCEGAGQLRVP